ncbi:MAG: phosphate acyltransferase PlsX [bacterium]|nr:phosphate acyltransferase PlsX [bacterium]MYB11323.1 phosphate acyltransferase PlsX [Acidimicrobiia bacterium]MYG59159.1 phosphate acyltransferase PlsX [Acidimicrobiia bacterium]MYJ33293.1 phosphate acyltransferase PlsX [Acidimicrobiia bacterium]
MTSLPVAVDAMGGDDAPQSVLAGVQIAAERGIPILLVGQPEQLLESGNFEVIPASQVIDMGAEGASSVRKMKDASVVRAAEAVRDGRATAMVSAGNTGAAMAASLLRMGRIRGVSRPAIATPILVPGRAWPNVLLDSGANTECTAGWLVQFAQMGAVYCRDRWGVEVPRIGLLSNGEEAGKGSPLVKEAFELLEDRDWQDRTGAVFAGNVEGRDLLEDLVDVIVTDGFTGNVALKTAEGVAKQLIGALLGAFDSSDEARQGAELLAPALVPLYEEFSPDSVGGAILLGVSGVSIISHGASSPTALANAIQVAHELAERDTVGSLRRVLSSE